MRIAPGLQPSIRSVVERDLGRFPAPWLKLMEDSGVRVAVFSEGDTLVDSPAMQDRGVQDLASEFKKLKDMPQDADAAQAWLLESHSPFRLAFSERAVSADEVAEQRHVPLAHREEYKQLFQALNPYPQQVYLLPPVPTDHGYHADAAFQSARETRAEHVAESLGLNRGPERLVLLHERFLPDNAPEIGDYRVAIHEVGHALDYVLEGLPDATGYGRHHSEKVEELFQQAQQKGVFTSDRADDNVREFFAEGVEAYFTEPSAHDFRPNNHRDQLKSTHPELYTYLDQLFHSQPGQDWKSQAPAAPQLPPGFPDPDRDPVYLS